MAKGVIFRATIKHFTIENNWFNCCTSDPVLIMHVGTTGLKKIQM